MIDAQESWQISKTDKTERTVHLIKELLKGRFGAIHFYKPITKIDELPVSGAISLTPDWRWPVRILESEQEFESTGSDKNIYSGTLSLETEEVLIQKSPFSQIDYLREIENQKIRECISQIPEIFEEHFGHKLSKRLKDLFEGLIDDAEERDLSFDSLQNFLAFFQSEPNLKYPSLVTSPLGNIVAEWRIDSEHHFGAEFLPNKNVRFVVFAPNSKNPLRIDRISGITQFQTLMDTFKPHNVNSWALINNE